MRHFSRVLLLSLPAGAFLLAALSCASTAERAAVVDNTFPSTIQNESDFAVVIDGVSLAPKASTSHRFPLHEGALYDGWSVEYSIPLTSAVQCTVREKLAVADGQATVRIENPRAECMDGCYVIVQNEHARALQCTDGDKSKIYPCYTSGVLGGRGTPSAYTVAARASAVCVLESAAMRLYLAADERNALPVAAPCTYRRGYVYTVRYDENGVRLRDARPLQCAQEALWAKSYPASTVLRDVLQRDGRIFALATETLQDAKGNAYISSFVQCLTLRGEALWKQEYGEKGADTYLYAMTLVDGNILVAGQRIAGGMSGILLLYAPSGTLLKAASVTEAVGLDALTVLADGRVLAGGYDAHGQAVMFSVPPSLAATPQKTPAGYRALQAAVQSLSCMVAGADGALYAAGETPQQALARDLLRIVQVHQRRVALLQRLGVVFLLPLLAAQQQRPLALAEALVGQHLGDELRLAAAQEACGDIYGYVHGISFSYKSIRFRTAP